MSTTNLQLETIELTDNMQSNLLNKMNNNFKKIDEAYKVLKEGLLNQTGKETISEAIDYVDDLANERADLISELEEITSLGNATETDIVSGKTAVVKGVEIIGTAFSETTTATSEDIVSGKTAYDNEGNLITGTTKKMPTINVELTGNSTYIAYISGYGAGIDQNGNLVIWATSNSTAYEHFNFVNTSIGAGTIGVGWNITTAYDTADPAEAPHACTITGLQDYTIINISLNASAVDATDDYITIKVTLTAE